MNDLQEYEKQYRELLRKLSEVEKTDYNTKKELILRLREVTKPLIEAGKYPGIRTKDTALFLYNQISEYGITYSRGHFYELFPEEEKGNYSPMFPREHLIHDFVQDPKNPAIQRCECGEIKLDGIIYDQKVTDDEPKEKNQKPIIDLKLTKEQQQGLDYLELIESNARDLASLTGEILEKFKKNEDVREPFIKELGDVKSKLSEQKTIEAKLLGISKMQDFRNKVSPFEKIMAKLLIDTTYNIAKVAKLLQISPKHATNNIVKQNHYSKLQWFRSCPACGVDIADKCNEIILKAEEDAESGKDTSINTKIPIPTV